MCESCQKHQEEAAARDTQSHPWQPGDTPLPPAWQPPLPWHEGEDNPNPPIVPVYVIPKDFDPSTFEEALDLVLTDMRAIMLDRQRKYGPTNITRGGIHGLIVRIGDKLARIEEDHKDCPFKGKCNCRELPDEAREDAWLDLANYSGPIALMLQRGVWGLPLEEDYCAPTS